MRQHVFYSCCEVGVLLEAGTWLRTMALLRDTPCWSCGQLFTGTLYLDLDEDHSLKNFIRTGRMTRPTDKTPPWRI